MTFADFIISEREENYGFPDDESIQEFREYIADVDEIKIEEVAHLNYELQDWNEYLNNFLDI